MKNLILIRHGKLKIFEMYSIFTLKRGDEIVDILNLYDTSEISNTSNPSPELVSLCRKSEIFICSDLQRTADSFFRMGITTFERSKLLNEAELPSGILKDLVLPLGIWAFLFRCLWFAGIKTNCESYTVFLSRMNNAYEYINTHFMNADSIVVMSHGFVNITLKKIFIKNGWGCIKQRGCSNYWSFAKLIKW